MGAVAAPVRNVAGVILAAGYSSRMGRNKMLLPVGSEPLVGHCIRGLLPVCSRVIVVLGHDWGSFAPVRRAYPGIEFHVNREYEAGMFSSVLAGLSQVRGAGALVLPGDCPFVSPRVYRRLLDSGSGRAVPEFAGRPGHPVLLDEGNVVLLPKSGVHSLREFLYAHGCDRIPVDDRAVLMDLDDRDAFEQAAARYDNDHHGRR